MPRRTILLMIAATLLSALWAWAWVGLTWTQTLPILPPQTNAEGATQPLLTDTSVPARRIARSAALLEQPVYYPDRKLHGYRPGASEADALPKATLDFELTTTVVGKRDAFAMLRLRGGRQSVVARAGQPFEADPAWRVIRIGRTSVDFVNAQGVALTLNVKAPAPTQARSGGVVAAAPPAAVPGKSQAAGAIQSAANAPPPRTAVRPMQENADVRARIEARRRDAGAPAPPARTQ